MRDRYRARASGSMRRVIEGYAAHGDRIRRIALHAGAGTVVVGLASGWLLWGSDHTTVDEVTVTVLDPRAPSSGQPLTDGTARRRAAQILGQIDDPTGRHLVDVDTLRLSRQVEELRRYSKVLVTRGWPDRVDITVTPRVAVLAATAGGTGVHLLDGDGLAFERVDGRPPSLPEATLSGNIAASGPAAVAAFLALPGSRREQVRGLQVDPSGVVELQVGGVRVRWGAPGQERMKAAVVDALIDTPGIERLDVSVPLRPVTTGGE